MNTPLGAAVVHDVKNRLAILGDELARLTRLPLDAQAQRHVAAASEQSALLTRKLVEFLTVMKADGGGGLHAAVHEELPDAFLEEVHADAQALAGARVELVTELDSAPAFWFFDRQLVRLALDSAIYNALRFASARIVLGCRMDGGRLCFYVSDDGPGVQDVACATSTGLGRRLCDEVARAHKNQGRQGRSALRNHGSGAVFELHLP